MARSSATITDDDEEIDLASFMLDACGIAYSDFMLEERILTREIFEGSLEVLLKMAEHRSFRRSTYFVIGYFFLVTGAEMPEDLRYDILEAAN
ncbi:MAG: hypothetical protein ACTSRI_01510 [Promethearchaeota archaeon]